MLTKLAYYDCCPFWSNKKDKKTILKFSALLVQASSINVCAHLLQSPKQTPFQPALPLSLLKVAAVAQWHVTCPCSLASSLSSCCSSEDCASPFLGDPWLPAAETSTVCLSSCKLCESKCCDHLLFPFSIWMNRCNFLYKKIFPLALIGNRNPKIQGLKNIYFLLVAVIGWLFFSKLQSCFIPQKKDLWMARSCPKIKVRCH